MVKTGIAFIVLGLTLLAFLALKSAEGSHNVYLPLTPNTWLMQSVIGTQEQIWCVDSRAANYPNFVSQLEDVNNEYTERVGITHRRVSYTDPACMVRHRMADSFPCGAGAAACIYYASKPVDVFYQWQLGYNDWRSAHGHELGHGLLGLHEQYNDVSGIGCTRRQDTVMDCGSGVRYPQAIDIERGCAIIATSWCGQQPAPPEPPFHSCTQYPGWEGTWSCYWPDFQAWLWEIPLHNRSSLWEWRDPNTGWVCTRGCP